MKIRDFSAKYLSSFYFFYSYLKNRIIVLFVLSIFVGLMDGLGLAMFLPLLEMVNGDSSNTSGDSMGNIAFILDIFTYVNLDLTLASVLFTIFFFFCLKGLFSYILAYLNVVYLQFFISKIRIEHINGLSNYRYDKFVKADAGRIQNTLSGEAGRVAVAFRQYNSMLQQGILVLTYSLLAFLSNPEFATLVAFGGVITNLIFKKIYKATKLMSVEYTQIGHSFQGLLIQQVAYFKYLKATGLINDYAKKLIDTVRLIEATQKRIGVLASIMQGIREPLMIGIVICVIFIQVNMLGGNLGTILLSILFFYRALTSVMQLQSWYNSFLGMSGSLSNMTSFSEELKEGRETIGEQPIHSFENSIILKKVSFSYLENTPILQGIDLELHKNQTLALVGESGSGKTTLMNILSGILTPSEGQMLIDGVDASKINFISFQKRIGYITQEPVIFDDSVFNNVTFWSPKSPENISRFYNALEKASIKEFIQNLPNGIDSRLGNNGINLSGGQKQRISIARELYKEVDLLYMDEATSALDSETEKAIQKSMESLKGQYTLVIIAHRLSTIKNADKVIVLHKGRIESIGDYHDLIEKSTSFKRMVELQEL